MILWYLPGHSAVVQFLDPVALPGQVSLPPGSAWLQARALNSAPRPQEAVHWDQEPQSCQAVMPTTIYEWYETRVRVDWVPFVTWTLRSEAICSFCGISYAGVIASKSWLRTRSSSNFGSIAARCWTFRPPAPYLPLTVNSLKKEDGYFGSRRMPSCQRKAANMFPELQPQWLSF